ncbi:MAG: aminotransferase class III-fold pyridoxal phosphate-dependent enzyme [Anaerolineales bacterium]|jgi:4-aminobutyrate aminotransferase
MDKKNRKYLSPVWSRTGDFYVSYGKGCYLYDQNGEEYLDLTTGIGVTNTGHCHPRVVKAIQDQAAKLIHGQVNIVLCPSLLDLVGELRQFVPKALDGYFFSNSGAEAVEGAVKLAKMAKGRTNVIAFQGSFHGRTVGAMSLTTSKALFRARYQPLMSGVYIAPYPYAFRYGWDEEETSRWCLEELKLLLLSQTAPEETAAILVEPVLGEGGYVVPPKSFLQGLREIADENDILLICDEVQSGFGRTGRWFAFEHFDIMPDIITIAKGAASGMPFSGVIAPLSLMEKWSPASHGGTYGGNPVSAAAAAETIRVIREEGLLENAKARGEQLMAGLRHLQKQYPVIADVRGLGLMVGAEMRDSNGKPDATTAKAIIEACFEEKMILLDCGLWDNTVRWIPPLIITEDQIAEGLDRFEKALKRVAG